MKDFAQVKDLNYDQVKKEFKKLKEQSSDEKDPQLSTSKKGQKGVKKEGKILPPKEKGHNPSPWEKVKKQFIDWPEEKLAAYVVQIESRLAELNSVEYKELTPEENKELGRLRRERRAILSDPDPEKICNVVRNGKKCNNPAERGKEVCWNHGGAPGSGCPPGRKNALKTGEHETFWADALTPEQAQVLERIDVDPIIQIDDDIRLYSLREREMLLRIRKVSEGLTEKQRRVLQERRKNKEAITVYDDKTGQTEVVTVPVDKLVITELEETEFRPIDDIIRLEEALTRVQDKKVKALKTKYELLGEEERRLRSEKLKVEVDKIKGEGPSKGDTWSDLTAEGDDNESEGS